MFERTFSFWRRWVGQSQPKASNVAGVATLEDDERRLWVRYPADLQAKIQLSDQGQGSKAAAHIRDISRGGANLLLGHEVQLGQLLNLELPATADDGAHTVLACVVRVNPATDGRWEIGCVFSRELTDDDLGCFGAKRVRHDGKDQRTWMRFECQLTAQIEKIGDSDARRDSARVLNVSASGVGLLVDRYVDAGALLIVELIGTDQRTRRTILACVVHVNQREGQEWALGCNFIRELSEEDIQALV